MPLLFAILSAFVLSPPTSHANDNSQCEKAYKSAYTRYSYSRSVPPAEVVEAAEIYLIHFDHLNNLGAARPEAQTLISEIGIAESQVQPMFELLSDAIRSGELCGGIHWATTLSRSEIALWLRSKLKGH